MKPDFKHLSRQFLAVIVGLSAVAVIVAAIAAIGYFGEPYLQWVPSVGRMHTSVNSYVLFIWIGLQLLMLCFIAVLTTMLALAALDRVRNFGNYLLSFFLRRAES